MFQYYALSSYALTRALLMIASERCLNLVVLGHSSSASKSEPSRWEEGLGFLPIARDLFLLYIYIYIYMIK